jgi:hypothetical protein
MLHLTRFALISLAGVVLAAQAGATTIQSTTFNSWKSNVTGSPKEADFSQVSYTSYNTASGIILSGIGDSASQFTFTGPDNGAYSLTGMNYNGFVALAGAADGSNSGINISLPGSGENAFLLVIGSTGNTPLSLAFSDGETFSLSSGIFGFSLSHPITSLYLSTAAGSQPIIDDFWYGASSLTQDATGGGSTGGSGSSDPAATPEAATLFLVLGGSMILGGATRKFAPLNRA